MNEFHMFTIYRGRNVKVVGQWSVDRHTGVAVWYQTFGTKIRAL